MNIPVKFKRLHPDAATPQYAHDGDSGFDLTTVEDVFIESGTTAIVPTGLAIELPPGFEAQVRPRSGVTAKSTLRVQLGTIDRGYTGEIGIITDNIEQSDALPYFIPKGDRIAQLVIAPVAHATFTEVDTLDETSRGEGAYGSTGVGFNERFRQNMEKKGPEAARKWEDE
ncbi:dUTP diphosphatase [Rossellomorea sp. FS2]|uniref:dUTP diphosphatase n=1 Tax=Rossellomorea sp. FS2 TaxID=3391447 RepID=UPI003A4E13AA